MIMKVILRFKTTCILWALLFSIAACSGDDNTSDNNPGDDSVVGSECGFVSIGSFSYDYLDSNRRIKTLSTEPVRLFYSFQKAVGSDGLLKASDLPVLVVFNGGPGAATSVNFLSMNTADVTLCKEVTGESLFAENKFSWRKMANVLYIDAPWTGFSYNYGYELPCGAAYQGLISANTFNCFVDADLMVRAMLAILDRCNVAKHQVYIVGESYGGTRATLMLNMLLFPENYSGDPTVDFLFKDKALVNAVKAHYWNAFGMKDPTPKEIAHKQFGKVVLVQPQLTGEYYNVEAGKMFSAEDSIIDQLWAKHTRDVKKWERPKGKSGSEVCMSAISYVQKQLLLDPYFVDKDEGFTDALENHATRGLMRADVLSKLFNLPGPAYLKNVLDFGPAVRDKDGAYTRCIGSSCSILANLIEKIFGEELLPPQLAVRADDDIPSIPIESEAYDLRNYLGRLSGTCDDYFKAWDKMLCFIYYIDSLDNNPIAKPLVSWIGRRYAKQINPDSVIYGEMFLHNLAVMDVMITNADKDIMIYSPALPPSLKHYDQIVSDVVLDEANSLFTVNYQPGFMAQINADTTLKRTVYHPSYTNCGHAVSVAKPEKLRKDMASFLGLEIRE